MTFIGKYWVSLLDCCTAYEILTKVVRIILLYTGHLLKTVIIRKFPVWIFDKFATNIVCHAQAKEQTKELTLNNGAQLRTSAAGEDYRTMSYVLRCSTNG